LTGVGTKVTPESFAAWKEKNRKAKEKEMKKAELERLQQLKSGKKRCLFIFIIILFYFFPLVFSSSYPRFLEFVIFHFICGLFYVVFSYRLPSSHTQVRCA
jgi:hypothetical protein